MQIALNHFVKRQTADSEYSHFNGSWEELLDMVSRAFNAGTVHNGYRDGVVLVEVCPDKFYTPIVELVEGDKFVGEFKPRVAGEEPRQSFRVLRPSGKQIAAAAYVVLYRHDVLVEGNEQDTDAEWEIISINTFPTKEVFLDEPPPMDPMTLMHNHFGSSGGTKTNMTPEKFEAALKRSFNYWKNKGVVGRPD